MNYLSRSLIVGCSVLALAACGPDEISSPGGGDIIINPGNGNGGGDGGDGGDGDNGGGGGVVAADECPTLGGADELSDNGEIAGPTGEYRVCAFPQVFTEDTTIPYAEGVLYQLPGRVDIGTDDGPLADDSDNVTGTQVALTIEPGVVVYAGTGRSYLVAQRGSQLIAEGTEDRPIVFTSRQNVLGSTTNSSSMQWGGVVLLGRAPVSDCVGSPNPADQADCQMQLEGAAIPPSFGGNTPDDNSGSLDYVQIRYSGFTISADSELQSLTLGGVGNQTGISHIQSYNSSDDGMEAFGGEPKMDHFIVVGAEDDSFDIDSGAKADLQYAVAVQRPGVGDNIIELDSPDGDYSTAALPRTNFQVSNFTFVYQADGSRVMNMRGTADLHLANGVVIGEGATCIEVSDEETNNPAGTGQDEMGPPMFNSVLLQCDVEANSDVAGYINDGTGNDLDYEPSLTNLVINGDTEDNYDTIFDATTISAFFTDPQPEYVGAIASGDLWHEGWTCDSETIDLNGGSSCLSLPVYN